MTKATLVVISRSLEGHTLVGAGDVGSEKKLTDVNVLLSL